MSVWFITGAGRGMGLDIWTERRWNASQAYSESKLYVTALAAAVARRWPEVLSNAVDPGWVPTKWAAPARRMISRWGTRHKPGLP